MWCILWFLKINHVDNFKSNKIVFMINRFNIGSVIDNVVSSNHMHVSCLG